MSPSKSKQYFLLAALSTMFLALLSERGTNPAHVAESQVLAAVDSEGHIVTPRATVGISKSSRELATDIDEAEIRTLVGRAVGMAGGLTGIVRNGDVVAIKPNLVTPYDDSSSNQLLPIEVNGVTTDWRVVKALVELIREINPNGKVYVMEGSAGVGTRWNMERLRYTHPNMPGVDEFISLEDSGGWHEWSSALLSQITLPRGLGLYPNYLKPNRSDEFYLNKMYFEADVLISVPVLKNHYCTGITGAIKNVGIGGTPANIYGSSPSEIWRGTGIDHSGDMEYLHKWIHDFYICRPIDFVLMDGLQSVSNGPTCYRTESYEANRQNMRLILAGKDSIAVDAIASLIVGIDPYEVDHLVQLAADNMGYVNPALIRVEGHLVHGEKKSFDLDPPGAHAKYSDFDPPALTINSLRVVGNELHISLTVSLDTVLVEVALDGKRLRQAIVDGFNDIVLDISHLPGVPKEITVYAYDRFLNRTEEHFVGQEG